jgi:centriolar protein POC1
MVSSSKDSTLRLWDVREGRLLYTLEGHKGGVNSARFSADGGFFASGGADQMVMIWKSNLMGLGASAFDCDGGDKYSAKPIKVSKRISANAPTDANTTLPMRETKTTPVKPPKPNKTSMYTTASEAATSTVDADKLAVLTKKSPHQPISSPPRAPPATVEGPDSTKKLAGQTSAGDPMPLPSENSLIGRDDVPPALASTLDHIVGQLDILTRTMMILESRLTLTEDRVSTIVAQSRGLEAVEAAPPPPSYH